MTCPWRSDPTACAAWDCDTLGCHLQIWEAEKDRDPSEDLTGCVLIIAGACEPQRRSTFDAAGELVQEDAWYWARRIVDPAAYEGNLIGWPEDPKEPVAPFYSIRSGPVCPLTFARS